ncbi:MAG: hypothetical protein H7Y31_00415 [Chitinophagaceae bacterium]|nr:hypothetical protein [Chitinophagaceae bacterium]
METLHRELRKTYSYRGQMRGEVKQQYERLYDSLYKLPSAKSTFEEYYRLCQLVFRIRDNHLFFSQIPEEELTNAHFADSSLIKAYRRDSYCRGSYVCKSLVEVLYQLRNILFHGELIPVEGIQPI